MRGQHLEEVRRRIQTFKPETALAEKRRYERVLKWLTRFETAKEPVQPKVLNTTILQVVKKLRENVFLMDLAINGELEPGDKLADLLEDYYDGLLIQQRQEEEFVPWEQVKAKLDARQDMA